jgi:CBS domain containing-hemolysin-like protein
VKALLFIVLLILFLSAILIDKAYKTVGVKELRRRARSSKDKGTSSIYKLVSLNGSLKLFLWLVGSLSAVGLLLMLSKVSTYLVVVAVPLGAWLVLSNRPLNSRGFIWKITALISTPTFKIVNFLHPFLSKLSRFLHNIRPVKVHTGLYDKDDLLELINTQNHQVDNRIPEEDLKIAFGALTFGDKLVREVMVPRRKVTLVAATDTIGPLLMDELHKSGFSRFPVVKAPTKEANPEIVGTLYLKDLLDHGDRGKVGDIMKKGVTMIQESQTLREALAGFLKTQHHLFAVVNDFEEISGVISMEDVMEQILGSKINDESNQLQDVRAEAEENAKKEQSLRKGI